MFNPKEIHSKTLAVLGLELSNVVQHHDLYLTQQPGKESVGNCFKDTILKPFHKTPVCLTTTVPATSCASRRRPVNTDDTAKHEQSILCLIGFIIPDHG